MCIRDRRKHISWYLLLIRPTFPVFRRHRCGTILTVLFPRISITTISIVCLILLTVFTIAKWILLSLATDWLVRLIRIDRSTFNDNNLVINLRLFKIPFLPILILVIIHILPIPIRMQNLLSHFNYNFLTGPPTERLVDHLSPRRNLSIQLLLLLLTLLLRWILIVLTIPSVLIIVIAWILPDSKIPINRINSNIISLIQRLKRIHKPPQMLITPILHQSNPRTQLQTDSSHLMPKPSQILR